MVPAAWALYDFANTIWSMNVATLYFSVWLISDLGASNTAYAVANGVSSALVALSIPLLGAISDARGRRKPWIVGFTLVACAATAVQIPESRPSSSGGTSSGSIAL